MTKRILLLLLTFSLLLTVACTPGEQPTTGTSNTTETTNTSDTTGTTENQEWFGIVGCEMGFYKGFENYTTLFVNQNYKFVRGYYLFYEPIQSLGTFYNLWAYAASGTYFLKSPVCTEEDYDISFYFEIMDSISQARKQAFSFFSTSEKRYEKSDNDLSVWTDSTDSTILYLLPSESIDNYRVGYHYENGILRTIFGHFENITVIISFYKDSLLSAHSPHDECFICRLFDKSTAPTAIKELYQAIHSSVEAQ